MLQIRHGGQQSVQQRAAGTVQPTAAAAVPAEPWPVPAAAAAVPAEPRPVPAAAAAVPAEPWPVRAAVPQQPGRAVRQSARQGRVSPVSTIYSDSYLQ